MSPIADERPLAFLPVLEDMAQPADLEVVRSSYARVADNYVAMGVGELAPTPWLRAALAAFAEDVNGLGPVLDVGSAQERSRPISPVSASTSAALTCPHA